MAETAEKTGFTIYHHVMLSLLNTRPYDSCTTEPPPQVVSVFSFQGALTLGWPDSAPSSSSNPSKLLLCFSKLSLEYDHALFEAHRRI